MDFTLFDPTIPAESSAIDYAPRPKQLNNLKIALVENTKYNSRTILLKVYSSDSRRGISCNWPEFSGNSRQATQSLPPMLKNV